IPTEGIAIEMLVDVSGSMAQPDFNWQGKPISRLDAVQKVFHLFVEGGAGPGGQRLTGRPEDLIGLVTFATWPESPCPLTLSHAGHPSGTARPGRQDPAGRRGNHGRPLLPGARFGTTAGRLPGDRSPGAPTKHQLSVPPLLRRICVVWAGELRLINRSVRPGI